MRLETTAGGVLLAAMFAISGCGTRPVARLQREYALSCHAVICVPYARITSAPVETPVIMPSGYTWLGYRDDNPTTNTGDTILIGLWLAGRDPGVDIIGFSAQNASKILMNTIIVCADHGPAEVECIPGFVLHRREMPLPPAQGGNEAPTARLNSEPQVPSTR